MGARLGRLSCVLCVRDTSTSFECCTTPERRLYLTIVLTVRRVVEMFCFAALLVASLTVCSNSVFSGPRIETRAYAFDLFAVAENALHKAVARGYDDFVQEFCAHRHKKYVINHQNGRSASFLLLFFSNRC
jgi:hypothetical protein